MGDVAAFRVSGAAVEAVTQAEVAGVPGALVAEELEVFQAEAAAAVATESCSSQSKPC